MDIARERLRNQLLAGNPLATPEDVIRRLGAVQAQDYPAAKWALAQRIGGDAGGITSAELDQAFADGRILRTHVMRPTWHFVLPDDIRWMLELTAPRVRAAIRSYDRKLALDRALLDRSNDAIARALEGGKHLTRTELSAVLRERGIEAKGQRLGHIVSHAELDAVVCSGPLRGKQFTYALLAERAPRARKMDRDEALAELTRRYFASHGPATLRDYCWWSGLTMANVRAGVEMVAAGLVQETVNGKAYWLPASRAASAGRAPAFHLLPNYDEHIVAYREHAASFERKVLARVRPDSDVLTRHIVVRKGLVIGGWRNENRKDGVAVVTRLLVRLDPAERAALERAVRRYARYLGVPVTLS
jgi:Winged helix DNA-binding domain